MCLKICQYLTGLFDSYSVKNPTAQNKQESYVDIMLDATTHEATTLKIKSIQHDDTCIVKRVSWFKSSLLLRIQSDYITNINS